MPNPRQLAGQDVVRSRSHQTMAMLGAAVCLVVVVVAVVVAVGKSSPVGQLVLAAVFALLGLYCVRSAMASVSASPASPTLVVRNPLRTYELPWSEVEGFELHNSLLTRGRGQTRKLIRVKLRGRRAITCVGACGWGQRSVMGTRDELQRLHGLQRLGKTEHSPVVSPEWLGDR